MRRTICSWAPTGLITGLLLLVASCGSLLPSKTGKPAVRAQYREQGSACELEVVYSFIVRTGDPAQPSYYHKASGDQPEAVSVMADQHTVLLTFGSPVSTDGVLEVGASASTRQSATISRNLNDQATPQLLDARFAVDAAAPTVVLTFDEAIDVAAGEDPASYTVKGSNQHPVSASLTDCNRGVELTFDGLAATTALDVLNVSDLNGNVIDPRLNVAVSASVDHGTPEIESLTQVSDAAQPQILAAFTEAVDRTTAERTTNYTLQPDAIAPVAAELRSDGRSVLLTFARISTAPTLDIAAVTDLNGNTMLPDTARTLQ